MKRIHLILFFTFARSAFAQADDLINADRPGIADGSSIVGRGVFQIETGFERDHTGPQQVWSTPTLLRYGLTPSLELRAEGNGYQHGDGSAWAPVSIGAKYRFREEPSLGVIARVFALNTDKTTGDLRLAADFDLSERWSLNPNIGVAFQNGFTAALGALTVQYNVSKHTNVFVDGGVQAPEERGGTTSLLLDAGAAWILGRDTQLDISTGWGAHGSGVPNVFWSAGISRRF